VLETHHSCKAINIISQEKCNVLSSLNHDEEHQIWTLIFQLILATDMANHMILLSSAKDYFDPDIFDLNNPDHRLLTLKLILKCGDLSNVSRPFQIADRYCDVLYQGFSDLVKLRKI
jgi:hypothetical protein